MRFITEAEVRGELLRMELSDSDFCPECCGTLQAAGSPDCPVIRCLSCYLAFKPLKEEPCRD